MYAFVCVCVRMCRFVLLFACVWMNRNVFVERKEKPKQNSFAVWEIVTIYDFVCVCVWWNYFLFFQFLSSIAVHDAWIEWCDIAKCLWQSFRTWRWYGWIERWWRIIWLDHWNGLATGHWWLRFVMGLLIPMHKMLNTTSMIIIQINGK